MLQWCKLFIDVDGTLCGENEWKSFIYNTSRLFSSGLIFKPPVTNKWSVLTSRPMIDTIIVKLVCKKYNLYPEEIITSPTWFYSFKNKDHVVEWKSSVISSYLNNCFYDHVIYVDNDEYVRRQMINIFVGENRVNVCDSNNLQRTIQYFKEDKV